MKTSKKVEAVNQRYMIMSLKLRWHRG